MGLYNRFKSSKEAETGGSYFVIENQRILLARAGGDNKPFTKAMADWLLKNKKALELDAMDNDVARAAFVDLYSRLIVLGWDINEGTAEAPVWVEGIEGEEEGSVIPFTVENVKMTLTNLPDLMMMIKQLAENGQNYRAALVGQTVKN